MNIATRTQAEGHLATAARHLAEDPRDMRIAEVSALIGNGYAALAAGQTAFADVSAYRATVAAYRRIVIAHIAGALSDGSDEEFKRARGLAQALDEAGLNVDAEVDEFATRCCEVDPKKLWTLPSERYPELDDVPF